MKATFWRHILRPSLLAPADTPPKGALLKRSVPTLVVALNIIPTQHTGCTFPAWGLRLVVVESDGSQRARAERESTRRIVS